MPVRSLSEPKEHSMTRLRWVRFESAALGGVVCEVKELSGEEELNRLFSFSVRVAVLGLPVTQALLRDLLQSPAALVLEEHGVEAARIHGVLAQVSHGMEAEEEGAALLSLTLVPRAWALSQTRRSEYFMDRSVPQILAERLSAAGLEEGTDFVLTLRGRYAPRELVAQHDESDWDFISRLCEDLGIVFFFRQGDGREVLVLTDTSNAFEPITRPDGELCVGARSEHRAAFDATICA
jgi:type VI secretion system secreted protein VgrG